MRLVFGRRNMQDLTPGQTPASEVSAAKLSTFSITSRRLVPGELRREPRHAHRLERLELLDRARAAPRATPGRGGRGTRRAGPRGPPPRRPTAAAPAWRAAPPGSSAPSSCPSSAPRSPRTASSPSNVRAALSIARRVLPPRQSGGQGRVSGTGRMTLPSARYARSRRSTGSPDHAARIASTPSSTRSARRSKSAPSASNSFRMYPAPTAAMPRPRETRSSVPSIRATTNGLR